MNISIAQYKQLLQIAECLSASLDSNEVRFTVGELLLKLLDADYYQSYIWNDVDRKFADGVAINMDTKKLKEYEQHYQFHDPITPLLQKRKRATCVNEVIEQEDLVQTRFYNDFLCHDGLYWGLHLYVHDGRENIGDIRLWRSKIKQNFDKSSAQLLQMVQPYFTNFLRNVRLFENKPIVDTDSQPVAQIATASLDIKRISDSFGFTRRESEIVRELLRGKRDEGIAQELCIAYSTLRTHIKHIYAKTSVHNRSALCHKVLSQLTGVT